MQRVSSRHGFTLVELLVVIGIIAVLIGLLLPVLGRARSYAKEIRSESDLRQLLIAYTQYHTNNRGSVLLGYPPTTLTGTTLYDPRLNRNYTGSTAGLCVARYSWRLLPYIGNIWQVLHSHSTVPPLPLPSDTDAQALNKAYAISLNPTFGLNATFLGGDNGSDGFINTGLTSRINAGKHVVFKANEVRNPTRMIVFANSKTRGSGEDGLATFRLTPPRTTIPMWHIVNGKIVQNVPSIGMGVPEGWFTRRVVVGFFDGHVEAMLPEDLEDMRLWANRADRADYTYTSP